MARYLMMICWMFYPTLTLASDPVAIIEDLNAPHLKLQMFDELKKGQRFLLRNGTAIISYLKSCRRETIKGGTVIIGFEKSTVTDGKLSYEVVECDGGAMNLSAAEAGKSAVAVFRAPVSGNKLKKKNWRPQIILYGSSPIIRTDGSIKSVQVSRLDKSNTPRDILLTGRLTDLVKLQIELEPGGIYQVKAPNKTIIIKIDALAEPGNAPLLGRLLRF